jgi:hypothetical protein
MWAGDGTTETFEERMKESLVEETGTKDISPGFNLVDFGRHMEGMIRCWRINDCQNREMGPSGNWESDVTIRMLILESGGGRKAYWLNAN